MNSEEVLHVLALRALPGIGDVNAKQLISYCGSAAAVFEQRKGMLGKIPGIGEKTIASIVSKSTFNTSEVHLQNCEKQKIEILPYYHSKYPNKLKLVNDAPLLLFYKGKGDLNHPKIVSVVGTRNATEYGKEMTLSIIEGLKMHDVQVVSGLAYGIDIAAHRGALDCHMSTIGVLAGGMDRLYPAIHKSTAEAMLELGGLLTEQPPGTQPEAHFFPARNRIIAGMADTTIVVEAAKKGGALITANIAHSYNREVFAVPGNLDHKYSEGCNYLIRSQKANIYTSIADLEYLLNWEVGKQPTKTTTIDLDSFSEAEQKLLRVMAEHKDGIQLDELSWQSQISINQTMSLLLNLEFAGVLKALPGKMFRLV